MKPADPSVTEREAREILAAQYGLQSPELRPIQGTGGAIKSIYRVRAGEREYLLKRYRPDYRSLRDVTEIYGAQVFLEQGALPVAPVIPNREGLLASVGACGSWVLYAYIVGHQYREGEIPTRAAAALGEAVARQVILLAGWQTPGLHAAGPAHRGRGGALRPPVDLLTALRHLAPGAALPKARGTTAW